MRSKAKEVPFFLGIGGICYLLNLLLLAALSELTHLHYLVSAFLAFLLVNIVGYQLNRQYTFRKGGTVGFLRGLWKYNTVMMSSCLVILVFMYVMVDLFHVWYILANIIITAIMTIYNFVMHKKWTFKSAGKAK